MKEYQSLSHTRWDCKYHVSKRSAAGVRTPSTKVMQIGPQRVGGEHRLPDARRELMLRWTVDKRQIDLLYCYF